MGVPGSSPGRPTSYKKFGSKMKQILKNISIVKFGIVYKSADQETKKVAEKAALYLKFKGHNVFVEKDLKNADFILTFGGDGTLIHEACEYADFGVPFVGINTGRLGFLCAIDSKDWKRAIDNLAGGKYFVSERITIEASIEPETRNQKSEIKYRAINECAINSAYRVVDLEILVNGANFAKIAGDGVIVATQTGSTAYSLSAGGPIVDPDLDSILITPVNPIGLPIPSAVFSPDDMVEVKLTKGDDVSLVLDGQEHTKIKEGEKVKVKSGKYKIKFVYFDKHHFLKSLNAKFGLAERAAR